MRMKNNKKLLISGSFKDNGISDYLTGNSKLSDYYLVVISNEIKREVIESILEYDDIVILSSLNQEIRDKLLTILVLEKDKNVYLLPSSTDLLSTMKLYDVDNDSLLLKIPRMRLSRLNIITKRIFDIVVASILLVLFSPLLLLLSIAIKIYDSGPVFYVQSRLGKDNVEFNLIKFRSMYVDAEKNCGAVWAKKNDSRITGIGKILRKYRLDELPQLINVIKGEMSLVGPRPERAVLSKEFICEVPAFKFRTNVKPGITGLAQVKGKYNTPPRNKLKFDMYYIRNYSFILDLKILLMTILVVLSKELTKENDSYDYDYGGFTINTFISLVDMKRRGLDD